MSSLVFLPVFKVQLEFQVKHGRRWTPLEHVVLWALAERQQVLSELAAGTCVPPRLIVECLINLMQEGWIEVQGSRTAVYFLATEAGKRALHDQELKYNFRFVKRFRTFFLERLTSTIFRPDERLRLMHVQKVNQVAADQPAIILEPTLFKATLRPHEILDRLSLDTDDQFERWLDDRVLAANLYAVFRLIGGRIDGLPTSPGGQLEFAIREALSDLGISDEPSSHTLPVPQRLVDAPRYRRAVVTEADLIIGGEAHFAVLSRILRDAKSYVVIHTTFMSEAATARVSPLIEEAALRGVEVDILWGERDDPSGRDKNASAIQAKRLEHHFQKLRLDKKVRIASEPTESHCKLLLADAEEGKYVAIVGSCNWLSSLYQFTEISVALTDPLLVRDVANALASLIMPPSGRWDRAVMRLVRIGEECRASPAFSTAAHPGGGMLIFDEEHYSAVRDARDAASTRIIIGCDWLGTAAATTVFVPAETAVENGVDSVRLLYQRADEKIEPDLNELTRKLETKGIQLQRTDGLHGKFLAWDNDNVVITSFNWLSTAIRGYRRGASEVGVLIQQPGIATSVLRRLEEVGC